MAIGADGKVFHAFRTIRDKLVKYRVGTGDTTGGTYRKFMTKGIRRSLEARWQAIDDLEKTAKAYLPDDYYRELESLYRNSAMRLEKVVQLWDGKNFKERLAAYRTLPYQGGYWSKTRMIHRLLLLPKGISNIVFSLIR